MTWHEILPTSQINYCADCSYMRCATMRQQNRCHPPEVATAIGATDE